MELLLEHSIAPNICGDKRAFEKHLQRTDSNEAFVKVYFYDNNIKEQFDYYIELSDSLKELNEEDKDVIRQFIKVLEIFVGIESDSQLREQ
jgi:hypothetical protein